MENVNLEHWAQLHEPILITGPTGTGKSCLAKRLFSQSTIYKEKFLTLNIATIKNELIESELFGHLKGSFTGAILDKDGYLKAVGRGTLFIDEIGELELAQQKKLLSVLEEKSFWPVGDTRECRFNGRLIFATHRDLKKMVREGSFREDLYYRISTFELTQKPFMSYSLVEKRNFIEIEMSKILGSTEFFFDKSLVHFIQDFKFSGNFRQAKNIAKYLAFELQQRKKSDSKILELSNLPSAAKVEFYDAQKSNSYHPSVQNELAQYSEAMDFYEKSFILGKLNENSGLVIDTAKKIGISKSSLLQKIKKHQINNLKIKAQFTS